MSYIISELKNKRRNENNLVEYEVSWDGFGEEENTWESRKSLVAAGFFDVIKEYESSRGRRTPRPSRRSLLRGSDETPAPKSVKLEYNEDDEIAGASGDEYANSPSQDPPTTPSDPVDIEDEPAKEDSANVENQTGGSEEEDGVEVDGVQQGEDWEASSQPASYDTIAAELGTGELYWLLALFVAVLTYTVTEYLLSSGTEFKTPQNLNDTNLSNIISNLRGLSLPVPTALVLVLVLRKTGNVKMYSKWAAVSLIWTLVCDILTVLPPSSLGHLNNLDLTKAIAIAGALSACSLAAAFTSPKKRSSGALDTPPLNVGVLMLLVAIPLGLLNVVDETIDVSARTHIALLVVATGFAAWRAISRIGLASRTFVSPRTLPHWLAVLAVCARTVSLVFTLATLLNVGGFFAFGAVSTKFVIVATNWLHIACVAVAALIES